MPRPSSKQALLAAIDKERGALEKYIVTLSAEQMTETDIVGSWSAKDVLAHVAEWEHMCVGWYEAGLRGETAAMPAPGFKWNQTPLLNHQIYKKYRDWPLEEVMARFQATHRHILEVITSISNEKMFTPGHFAWTKKNTLGTYMVSATSSHYVWAKREIRKGFRMKQKAAQAAG